MFKLHEKKVRKLLVLLACVFEIETILLRWKCPLCNRTWTEYPWFIEPHKRYVKQSLILKVLDYVCDESKSYRKLTSQNNSPIWYEQDLEKTEDARCLSHTTLHYWVGWLGRFNDSLSAFMKWLSQKIPQTLVFQKAYQIHPRKYKSEERHELLKIVMQWAKVANELVRENLEKIFLHFAPHTGPPGHKIVSERRSK